MRERVIVKGRVKEQKIKKGGGAEKYCALCMNAQCSRRRICVTLHTLG